MTNFWLVKTSNCKSEKNIRSKLGIKHKKQLKTQNIKQLKQIKYQKNILYVFVFYDLLSIYFYNFQLVGCNIIKWYGNKSLNLEANSKIIEFFLFNLIYLKLQT